MIRTMTFNLLFFFVLIIDRSYAKKEEKIDQLQLQESVQRFYTRFTQRTLESLLTPIIEKNYRIREMAMRQYLLYDSEALKVATGPYPELNLLDMMVFIKLNRLVLQRRWIQKQWGRGGRKILNSFRESEKDIDEIALKVISEDQVKKVNEVAKTWLMKNPRKYRVEKIRLDEFSGLANQMENKKGKGFSLSNLLVDTKSAVQAVDQVILVANRGIFLAQYLPSIMRLQARLGASEVIDDVGVRLRHMDRTLKQVEKVNPLIVSASGLASDMGDLTEDAHKLLTTYKKEFPEGVNISGNLKSVHQLIDEANVLLRELKNINKKYPNALTSFKREFRQSAFYIALLMTFVGIVVSTFFWTGYYLVKRSHRPLTGENI